MLRLVNLMRLGISRGWRIRFLNNNKLYASSLLHCMIIYLLARSKFFKMGFWLITYHIVSSVKKYIIHIFYWKLPGVKKKRIFNKFWTVSFQNINKNKGLGNLSKLKILLGFTKIRNGFWWKFCMNKDKKPIKLSCHLQKSRNLIRFWFNKVNLIYLKLKKFNSVKKLYF